jgi:hypothetical protein
VAAELERPQEVPARGGIAVRDAGAAGVNGQVLLTVHFVHDRTTTDRRPGLEPPQLTAVASVQGEQVAVRLTDEQQVGGGGEDAVAVREGVRHPLLPVDPVRADVHRDDAAGLVLPGRPQAVAASVSECAAATYP